jgi:GTP-binding protein Era
VKALLPEGPRYYPEDMVTDLPERFIVAEMVREQVLRQSREEVPYGVAVTVESFTESPEKNLVVINAVIHVERDSQKRIVVGKGGARIRAIGQASRVAIERFLGCRVFSSSLSKVQEELDRFGSPPAGIRLSLRMMSGRAPLLISSIDSPLA